LNKTNNIR